MLNYQSHPFLPLQPQVSTDGEILEEKKWLGRDKLDAAVRDDDILHGAIRARLMEDEEEEENNEASGWDEV